MAWCGQFGDFDEFQNDFYQKPAASTKPGHGNGNSNYGFQGRGSSHQQQQQSHPNGCEVKRICDITSQTSYVTLTGVIIAKEQQRSVFSKKNVGTERHLVSFTVRDSPSCFVNVTCWGNADFIADIDTNFEIGRVVQLKNVQVQQKTANENDAKFKPWTPVSFQLNLSESHGTVEPYTGWDAATFSNTLSIPTRPSNDFYTLEDINMNGTSLQGEHINILALVKRVGQIRYLTTKTGKQTKKCDVVLLDDTCLSFSLDLWQNHVDATLSWTPLQTVLFIADAKITFNNFKSTMVATADCKTIFTVDPDIQEAQNLREFLRTQDSSALDMDFDMPKNDVDPDLESITEEFTVEQVKAKRSSMAQDAGVTTHYGRLRATLTAFNIDAGIADSVRNLWMMVSHPIIRDRLRATLTSFNIDAGIANAVPGNLCGRCRKQVSPATGMCSNPGCSSVSTVSAAGSTCSSELVSEYNIPVDLSDHTGTLGFCHLQQTVVEALLGCQPETFLRMSEDEKTQVKWQYLLENTNLVFKLRKFKQGTGHMPSIQVLFMERPNYTQQSSYQQGQGWR